MAALKHVDILRHLLGYTNTNFQEKETLVVRGIIITMYKCECDEENPQALPEASVQGGYDGVLAVSQLQISFTS